MSGVYVESGGRVVVCFAEVCMSKRAYQGTGNQECLLKYVAVSRVLALILVEQSSGLLQIT